jgi:prolyl 4-hydroxylase
MKSQLPIRPELRDWILTTTRDGHSVETVLKMMQENGYDPRQSRSIIATVLNIPMHTCRCRRSRGCARSTRKRRRW